MTKYQSCTKCIMDTTDPDISFDEMGVCNHCHQYAIRSKKEIKGEKYFQKIINEIKDNNSRCLIGLSGGTDSSMVAYLVKRAGLNPIGVSFDNGWDTETAKKNVQKLVEKLNIPLIEYKVDSEEFKDLQIAFLKASVPNAEIPTDHGIVSLLYRLAAKKKIKYIIHGGNITTEAIMPKSWGHDAKDLKHLKAIHKKFGKTEIKDFPTMGITNWIYYSFIKGIKFIPILNYIDYNKEEAKEILKKEFQWEDYGIKHGESVYTRFFQCYILPKKFGIDKRKAHFSTLINSGQMTRKEALEEMEKDPYPEINLMNDDKNHFLKKLNLTEREFEEIMNLPPKKHEDYPNNSFFFSRNNFLVKVAKKIITRNY
jgi:N-acetyl sugar amidotransferase